ncbi:hypothetical protein ONZ45_g10836 [Pleurotus djamor]|nr:hypothetical protein ONZ45_g10836 [Pleurotus djamor]
MVIVRRLLGRRNTYAAIFTLPYEILSKIFLIANENAPDITETLRDIASVCTYWRRICLDTPQLWAAVSLDQPLWLRESLRRSRTSPLTVTIDDSAGRCTLTALDRLASALVHEVHRFQEVQIICGPLWIEKLISLFFLPTLGLAAPLLRKLKISTGYAVNQYSHPDLLRIFWTRLDSLQSLELTGYVPITTSPMPKLTFLCINTFGDCLSVPWLMNLLRNAPHVEEVAVGTISLKTPMSVSNSHPINLPSLRSLELTFESLQGSEIFSHLEIPASIPCRIRFNNEHDPIRSTNELSPLKHFISDRIPPATMSLHLIICHNYGEYILEVRDITNETILVNISITYLPHTFTDPAVIIGSMPLERIHTLTLEGPIGDMLDLSNFLPYLINLRTIQVEDVSILFLIAGDKDPLEDATSDGFCNHKLERVSVAYDAKSTPHDWERFISSLVARYRHGESFRYLKVRKCNIPIEYAQQLEVCDDLELEWDGEGIRASMTNERAWMHRTWMNS